MKLLAEQTAKTTSEIGGQIREGQELTDNAVSSITSINDIVRSINDSTSIIAHSDASRETDRASGLVLSFSDAMSDEAEQLRTEAESFLHAIRDGDKSGVLQLPDTAGADNCQNGPNSLRKWSGFLHAIRRLDVFVAPAARRRHPHPGRERRRARICPMAAP